MKINLCWCCGVSIREPKYFITEKTLNYGVPSGTLITYIHLKCYNKIKKYTPNLLRYFINGLEETLTDI